MSVHLIRLQRSSDSWRTPTAASKAAIMDGGKNRSLYTAPLLATSIHISPRNEASKLQLNYSSYFKCLFIFCSWSMMNPWSDMRERLASMAFITSSETSRSLQVHPSPLYQPFYAIIISVYGHIPINIFLYNNVIILCALFHWVGSSFFFFSFIKRHRWDFQCSTGIE